MAVGERGVGAGVEIGIEAEPGMGMAWGVEAGAGGGRSWGGGRGEGGHRSTGGCCQVALQILRVSTFFWGSDLHFWNMDTFLRIVGLFQKKMDCMLCRLLDVGREGGRRSRRRVNIFLEKRNIEVSLYSSSMCIETLHSAAVGSWGGVLILYPYSTGASGANWMAANPIRSKYSDSRGPAVMLSSCHVGVGAGSGRSRSHHDSESQSHSPLPGQDR